MTTTPKPRLRWYQYSLRSLFVLTLLVAIGGSWFAHKRQQVERQRVVVKWVEETGGFVSYDWQLAWELAPSNGQSAPLPAPPGPAWLRAWLGDDFFAHVVEVAVFNSKLTDDDSDHLAELPQLKGLYLSEMSVTDAALEHLKRLPQLQTLWLYHTKISDLQLEHLKELAQLEKLNLEGAGVTDEGVKRLRQAMPDCKIER